MIEHKIYVLSPEEIASIKCDFLSIKGKAVKCFQHLYIHATIINNEMALGDIQVKQRKFSFLAQ